MKKQTTSNPVQEIWKKSPIKELMQKAFGTFGVVCYYVLKILTNVIPFAWIGENYLWDIGLHLENVNIGLLIGVAIGVLLSFVPFLADIIVSVSVFAFLIFGDIDDMGIGELVLFIAKLCFMTVRIVLSAIATKRLSKRKDSIDSEIEDDSPSEEEINATKQAFIQKYVIDVSKQMLRYYMINPILCPPEILLDRNALFRYIKENQDTSFETFKKNYYAYCKIFLDDYGFEDADKQAVLKYISENLEYLSGQEAVDEMIEVQDSMLGEFFEQLKGTVNYDSITMNGLMNAAEELGIPALETAIMKHMREQGYSK